MEAIPLGYQHTSPSLTDALTRQPPAGLRPGMFPCTAGTVQSRDCKMGITTISILQDRGDVTGQGHRDSSHGHSLLPLKPVGSSSFRPSEGFEPKSTL